MSCCRPSLRWTRGRCSRRWQQLGGGGAALPAGAATAGDLPLQACADPGYGLSVVAQEHAAAVPPADCPGVGGAISRRPSRPSPNCWPITTPRRACTQQAVPYWQRAGQRAIERSANVEAISHLTKGLELLKTLPDTPERIQQELDLQITLGPALMATKGYAPRKWNTPMPGRASCASRWGRPRSSSRCCGDCGIFILCGRSSRRARELGEQLLSLAQRAPRPGAPPGGPPRAGGDLVLSWRVGPCPRTPGAGHCPLRPPAAPLPSLSAMDRTPG